MRTARRICRPIFRRLSDGWRQCLRAEAKACAVEMGTGYLVMGIHADSPCEYLVVDLQIAAVLQN